MNKIKIGMVGLDTSHCIAFTKILHDEKFEHHLPGAAVTTAYPGGSRLCANSRDRVQGFTEQLSGDYGIPMAEGLAELVQRVDAILLESVDGRQHLEQFRQLAVGKPVFIDKPFACSTADARRIIGIAAETNTPVASSSSLRFAKELRDLHNSPEPVLSCEAYGPAPLLDDYPGLFWYGVHSAEVLFSIMGRGCRSVRCLEHPSLDIVLAEWGDGRPGVVRGNRLGDTQFGCLVHTKEGVFHRQLSAGFPVQRAMLGKVLEFFRSGVPPVNIEETFQIVAFLEAADTSKSAEGQAVSLETL